MAKTNKLRIGDVVVHRHDHRKIGRVAKDFGSGEYTVFWEGGVKHPDMLVHRIYAEKRPDLIRVCQNCGMKKSDHGNNGKCLYHPTSWS